MDEPNAERGAKATQHAGFTPMKMLCRATALLALLLSPGAARADMGFPGEKNRELRLVIDNLDDYPDYHFYWVHASNFAPGPRLPPTKLRPLRDRTWRILSSGANPVEMLLVAVPRERAAPDGEVELEALAPGAPGPLHSNLVRAMTPGSVIALWPYDYEARHYTITLADKRLTLKSGLVEQGTNGPDSWLPAAVAATLAVLGLGLWIAWPWRRPRRAPVA